MQTALSALLQHCNATGSDVHDTDSRGTNDVCAAVRLTPGGRNNYVALASAAGSSPASGSLAALTNLIPRYWGRSWGGNSKEGGASGVVEVRGTVFLQLCHSSITAFVTDNVELVLRTLELFR